MPCSFLCCNIDIIKEWFQTCNEYLGFTLKPFQKLSVKQIWCCNHNDWDAALTVWCVLQFWLAVIAQGVSLILSLIVDCDGNVGVISCIVAIVVCYFWSHLFWFGASKKQGCCFCLVCCPMGNVILLIQSILCFLAALGFVLRTASGFGSCDIALLYFILAVIHDISFVYMGICLLMLWQKGGHEIVPKAYEVKGPTSQTIGSSNV